MDAEKLKLSTQRIQIISDLKLSPFQINALLIWDLPFPSSLKAVPSSHLPALEGGGWALGPSLFLLGILISWVLETGLHCPGNMTMSFWSKPQVPSVHLLTCPPMAPLEPWKSCLSTYNVHVWRIPWNGLLSAEPPSSVTHDPITHILLDDEASL